MRNTTDYSSTKVKSRQPKQEDVQFSIVLNRIRTTGPVGEECSDIGDWQAILPDINAAALNNRLESTLAALTKSNPRLSSVLAMLPDQAEQEELHPDFKIGKHGRQVFKTLSEDDIEDFPDIESMISGLLQTASVSLLFGESNSGKTFIALDIAERVARGMTWQGRNVKQGPVLYIYAESRLGLKPRILAWKKHHDLPSTPNLQFITRPVQLVNDREMLLDTIAEQKVTPALVVVDTFSNCAEDVNQNDQAAVYKVLATAHEAVRGYGCHVLVVHHTNKNDGVNGSAAFKNHVDTMIKLSRADKYSPVVMHCEKQRDAEQFDDISLQLQIVDLYINPKTLEPVTSCVVIADNTPAAEAVLSQTQQKMLDILDLQGRASYNTWKKACEDAKVVKATSFYTHVDALVKQGRIKKDDSLGKGKPTWYETVKASSTSSEVVQSELDEVGTN